MYKMMTKYLSYVPCTEVTNGQNGDYNVSYVPYTEVTNVQNND